MFQTLATPFPTQSLRFSAYCPPISTSLSNRRPISVRCRAATVDDFAGCLSASRRPTSLYEVLKVRRNASPAEIKKAYRRLAKVFHPDTAAANSPDYDGRRFMEIHDAYETLSDSESRALYDLSIGFAETIMVASSAGSAAPFGCYAAAAAASSIGVRPGSYSTRRWETDQCW